MPTIVVVRNEVIIVYSSDENALWLMRSWLCDLLNEMSMQWLGGNMWMITQQHVIQWMKGPYDDERLLYTMCRRSHWSFEESATWRWRIVMIPLIKGPYDDHNISQASMQFLGHCYYRFLHSFSKYVMLAFCHLHIVSQTIMQNPHFARTKVLHMYFPNHNASCRNMIDLSHIVA